MFYGTITAASKKDWKTYSRFSSCLITEMPETAARIACGTDGEKAIIDGFQRNASYAIFLRCFIHYNRNFQEHLKKCGFIAESKQLFLEEIFGKQENTIKFCGLIDCSSDGDFDEKLKTLKPVWDARELAVSEKPTFHEWFITEKVDSFSLCFFIL